MIGTLKKTILREGYEEYALYSEEFNSMLSPYAKTGRGHGYALLSLENCKAIERGYDLDDDELEELAEDMLSSKDWDNCITLPFNGGYIKGVSEGFQKALEILGDNKKSQYEFIRDCATNWDCDEDAHKYNTTCRKCDAQSLFSSLTEWNVEIDIIEIDGGTDEQGRQIVTVEARLDSKGCLILSRTL